MLRSLIVIFSLYIVSFGADIDFSIEKSCYSVGDSMTLKAVYTGSGSVTAVQWTYTDQIGSNLFVLASTCDVAAIVQGFPERSRMTFDCDLTTNTFTLTLKDLKKEEFDKTWGATFSLSVGGSPAVQEKNFTFCLICLLKLIIMAILGLVFGCVGCMVLIAIFVAVIQEKINQIFALIGIAVCFIIHIVSIGLCAAVRADDELENCDAYVGNCAIASLVISAIGILAEVIVVILLKAGVIGQGK